MAPHSQHDMNISLVSDGEIPNYSAGKVDPTNPLITSKAAPPVNGRHHRDDFEEFAASIPLNPAYAYTPRKLRVITIGAGFSGLLMAHKFEHRFPELRDIVEHTVLEAREEIGGTWLVNDYPGVQCDVPAHIYAFPFDPNPNWTRFYASGPEIQEYIKRTARKWGLDKFVKLNSKVTNALWHEDEGNWTVTVEDTTTGTEREETCDILISSQGVLLHPAWPKNMQGLERFKGPVVHSARWDHSLDYSNKRIAVIGNGSSGIQIVPAMTKLPGTTVRNFIRGPAWVYYRLPPSKHMGREVDDDNNPAYLDEEKERFKDPEQHRQYRKGIIDRTNRAFRLFVKGKVNEEVVERASAQMAEKLGHDPDLCEKLIPKWELGCRRVTPGPGYLDAFTKPNCTLTNSPITTITEKGVQTADGEEWECDIVVCATGFDVSHRPRYPIIGQNGASLRDKWKDDPSSYLSIGTDGFPNYFIMMGPNCLGGHGSLVESLNWTGDYFSRWIKKISEEDIKYIAPKASAVKAFNSYCDGVHKTLIWTGNCSSWYKRGTKDGRVTALFGGSAVLFHRMIHEPRAEDFEISYRSGNKFNFMGNGFTEFEMRPDADLSWYVEPVNGKSSGEKKLKNTVSDGDDMDL